MVVGQGGASGLIAGWQQHSYYAGSVASCPLLLQLLLLLPSSTATVVSTILPLRPVRSNARWVWVDRFFVLVGTAVDAKRVLDSISIYLTAP